MSMPELFSGSLEERYPLQGALFGAQNVGFFGLFQEMQSVGAFVEDATGRPVLR